MLFVMELGFWIAIRFMPASKSMNKYKVAALFYPGRPATVARAKRVCERKRTLSISKKECASISSIFVENLSFSKKGCAAISHIFVAPHHRLQEHAFHFEMRSALEFHSFSKNCPFSNEECASISPSFVENYPFEMRSAPQFHK